MFLFLVNFSVRHFFHRCFVFILKDKLRCIKCISLVESSAFLHMFTVALSIVGKGFITCMLQYYNRLNLEPESQMAISVQK